MKYFQVGVLSLFSTFCSGFSFVNKMYLVHKGNALILQIMMTFCVFEGYLLDFTLAEAIFVMMEA